MERGWRAGREVQGLLEGGTPARTAARRRARGARGHRDGGSDERSAERTGPPRARARDRHHRLRGDEPGWDRLWPASRCALRGRRPLRRLGVAVPRQRLPARWGGAPPDVAAAGSGRGQDQHPAAALRRPTVQGRPAQPGDQRHRQHRPEPAADTEPDAHLDPAVDGRGDHDDHHLAVARRGGTDHGADGGVGDEGHRRQGPPPATSTPWSRSLSPVTPS